MSNAGDNTAYTARAGDRVAEWILQEPLGLGTFGEVWRGQHHVWADQHAAIKLPRDRTYLQALRREGVVAHRLDHPNVVRALGLDPFAKVPYLIMELVPGTTLRHMLGRGRLAPQAAVAVLREILAALSHAHARGVVHRDVKPENVLIHEQALAADGSLRSDLAGTGLVKLTDFGLGQAEHEAAGAVAGNQSIVFSTDAPSDTGPAVAGSLDYMAPEQRAGTGVDARADLYACGVVLFEMLTGERPTGTDLPSDVVADLPKHLDGVFRKSYTRIDRRYGSAEAFAGDLVGTGDARPDDRLIAVEHRPGQAQVRNVDAARRARSHACGQCGSRTDTSDNFCMACGHQLVPVVPRCPSCNAFPDPRDKFCMFCGQSLQPRLERTDVSA
jgi:serine/threonine protein kinase